MHKPLGVVAIVSPWNLPLLLLTWKVAPALAAGNTVVAKPSEITPSSATLLAEVMDEVGVPAGVHVTPISFELGGKNAALVFADADFDAAVAGTVRSAFTNSGQICLCTERVYVQREIYDRFVAALATSAG